MRTGRLKYSDRGRTIYYSSLLVCLTCSLAVRGRSLGTYRSGPLLSGTDTLALYWAWHGQGPGPFEHRCQSSKAPI